MATKEQMEKVKDIVVKLRYLECMDNIIYYDRWNNCPKDGFDYEGKVGAYLTELSNEKLTSKETKELVESLEGETAFDSDTDKGMVRYLIGKYKEAVQIPASLQGELNQANADGQLAWGKCYEADDFESFKPVLKKQFDLQEKIATAINPDEKPYQVLVNRFDKDYRLEEIDAILAKIKDAVCEILNAVREEQSKIDDSILECEADHDTVLRIVKKAQEILGLDKDKSTLFEIHHPVCVCTGPRDSRPSTNCDELIHAILAVVHETGHGLYNYNANDEVAESGLWGGIEGAMHESQSRFYENHVGRTREFWENLYPYLQKEVPKYKEISLDTFLAALNKVKPGLIRLKADELTNTLHIIIRYEIEKEYFDGKLTVDTIEEAWNRKYQEYLGFTPKNHQEGILQDVHWASGCVGYFQGYALGDAYAAQFAHKLLADCPDAFEKLGKGDSSVIGNWLKEHIHQYGQTYSAREMLKKATGEELNTGYYIEYLKEILKYRGVFYLLNIICGFSVFGAPLAVITLLGSGLYAGMIMTVSILEFGFAGGVIGMGLLLPQYLFYIPVWLYSMEQEWKISSEIWRNRGLISGEVSIYLKKMCIAAVGYFLGILIECYVNPLIIDIILKYIKIF